MIRDVLVPDKPGTAAQVLFSDKSAAAAAAAVAGGTEGSMHGSLAGFLPRWSSGGQGPSTPRDMGELSAIVEAAVSIAVVHPNIVSV